MRGRALVILLAVLLAPAAAGQGPLAPPALEVDDAPPAVSLKPDTGTGTLVFAHRLNCDWNRALLLTTAAARVRHEVTVGPGVIVTGPLTTEVPTADCAMPTTASVPFDVRFTVQATSDAPGEMPLPVSLASRVVLYQASSEPAEATSHVEVSYLGWLDVRLPATMKEVVDGRTVFTVELVNLGNSNTAVQVEADAPPGVTLDLPQDLVLESAAQGKADTEKTTAFTVRLGPGAGGEVTVEVTFTPVSTKDATAGLPSVVNVLVRNGSLPKAVESPGPVPVLIVPVLMGAVLLARRRS